MSSYWSRYRQVKKEIKEFNDCVFKDVESDIQSPDATFAENPHTNSVNNPCEESDSSNTRNLDEYNETSSNYSSDTIYHDSDTESEQCQTLQEGLAIWATKNKITRASLNELLSLLRQHGNSLPKDARTLLKTPRQVFCNTKCGGQYTYFGLETSITRVLQNNAHFVVENNVIELIVNVDGVPLFKSSNSQFWPILCKFSNLDVFILALYYGNSKPTSIEEFLGDFKTEYEKLCDVGFAYEGTTLTVHIKNFICDAPARSFLKCVIGHTGYFSCERCCIQGTWAQRVVFNSDVLHEQRTSEKFNTMEYNNHQKSRTPLIDMGINCIDQFTLDYMHLICLGVMKRILKFLKKGPRICRLSMLQISTISDRLVNLNGEMPAEFARQPRSLVEVDRWKATEFRQFLLYTGPVVLKSVVSKEIYEHFVTLSLASSILLDENDARRRHYLDYARDLMLHFVHTVKDVYGETFTVYNVHALTHIADDAKNESLSKISAFPFENHLQILKRLIRNGNNPMVQVIKRFSELHQTNVKTSTKKYFTTISSKEKDSCFIIKNERIAIVTRVHDGGMCDCDTFKMTKLRNLFSKPGESTLFNIGYLPSDGVRMTKSVIHKSSFLKKVVFLPYENGHVLFPMLHEVEKYS